MTIKFFRTMFYAAAITSVLFTACSKNDDDIPAKPSITEVEVGSDNSKVAYAGADLHLDASIMAPGNIAQVKVEIHPKTGSGWEYDSVYTEGLKGLKNADFHKHIDIPANARTGFYHLHITVTDERGQEVEFESDIEIKSDQTLPTLTGLMVELNDGGKELHVEATINAPNKIARVEVELHGPWGKEFSYTDADMVGKTSYNFHKHIDITAAPAGHYHIHIKVIDQAGKEREFEDHFDK